MCENLFASLSVVDLLWNPCDTKSFFPESIPKVQVGFLCLILVIFLFYFPRLIRSRKYPLNVSWSQNFTRYLAPKMSNSSAGPSTKPKIGSSLPSETSSKRKRGVFQKECENSFVDFTKLSTSRNFLLIIFLGCYSAAHDVWFWR